MSQKFIYFHRKDLTLHPSSSPTSIALLPSSLAIQSHCPSNLSPLEFAYSSKLLDPEKSYISFDFALPHSTQCFFFATDSLPSSPSVLLDLYLPPLLGKECALFVYATHSLFCFYQEGKLCYCKPIADPAELSHCLLLISKLHSIPTPTLTLFEYGYSHCFQIEHTLSLPNTPLTLLSPPPLTPIEHKPSPPALIGEICSLHDFGHYSYMCLAVLLCPTPSHSHFQHPSLQDPQRLLSPLLSPLHSHSSPDAREF